MVVCDPSLVVNAPLAVGAVGERFWQRARSLCRVESIEG